MTEAAASAGRAAGFQNGIAAGGPLLAGTVQNAG